MQNLVNSVVANNGHRRPEQFEVLAFPLMHRLYNMALRMTRDQLDAEDLVQDTYLRAYKHFHQFQPGTNFRAWIFRILTNNFANHYRKKKAEPARLPFDTIAVKVAQDERNDSGWSEDFGFVKNYEALFDDRVTTALDSVPETYRVAVLLSDVGELKYKEIAEALEVPVGTVMSRISRGRKILARFLRSYAVTNGFIEH